MSRILIVEDDTVLCRVLRNWLERKKMQVEVATTSDNGGCGCRHRSLGLAPA